MAAAYKYKPYGMSEKQLEEYRKYFWSQDLDGDGQLSRSEFNAMLKSMGLDLSPNEVTKLFKKTDKDKTSKISFHEFAEAFLAKKKDGPSDDRIQRIFRDSDSNHDGFLTREECSAALRQLGIVLDQQGLNRVMVMMDKNHDGRINYYEFRRFVLL